MNPAEKCLLYNLEGLLYEHRRFYRNRLTVIRKQQADQYRELSLSFLEGEARAYQQALARTEHALVVAVDLLDMVQRKETLR